MGTRAMNLNFPSAVCLACAASTLFMPSASGDDESQVIELGGLRQATAVVSSDNAGYTVAVQMVPVTAFDAPMNAAISRRLLIEAALRGLATTLSKEPITLTVAGLTSRKLSMEEEACRLIVEIPKAGLGVQSTSASADPASGHPGGATAELEDALHSDATLLHVTAFTGLLSRKREYATLVDTLASTLNTEINSLRPASVDEPDADSDSAGANLASRVSGNFRVLSAAIRSDLMLFSFEKQELLEDIHAWQQRLLKAIDVAAASPVPALKEEF